MPRAWAIWRMLRPFFPQEMSCEKTHLEKMLICVDGPHCVALT